ncbi:hypothetical protein G4Y79_01730 [Phototrophicus methaneseepsis]|uniref:SHOCT domain-containing protein n=1 Tax=Phototrophicus methaneseepsis TaxID=2710758 RepID=A0A7S8EA04_9CHLR|nr:hypothetical protein [Phototrophicus methaneseepsis]QPC83122.1 hypothetical protein G4Y79_01730 [Phototrophicus methaneseepsis]
MMMLPALFVLIVLCMIVWQQMANNAPAKTAHKEKRKAIPQTAHDILDERYANSEISREEYLATLEDIETNWQRR